MNDAIHRLAALFKFCQVGRESNRIAFVDEKFRPCGEFVGEAGIQPSNLTSIDDKCQLTAGISVFTCVDAVCE